MPFSQQPSPQPRGQALLESPYVLTRPAGCGELDLSQPATPWPAGYERSARLRLATIGRRTGRTHEVSIDFVRDAHLFVTGVSNNRDWMKNVLKNPQVTVTIDGVSKPMRAERINSEERRVTIEGLYRKKYGLGARLLRLARPGSFIFELSEPGDAST